MALINRISRLFRADLHAVLDRIEEPDALLKQAVREMEEDIGNNEQRLKLLQHELTQLTSRQTDISQSQTQVDDELDICFESDKEELARTLIKRKLEAQRFHKFLGRKHEATQRSVTDLQQRLEENRKRLTAMKQKLELLTPDDTKPGIDDRWLNVDITVSDAEVEVALLREKQQRLPS